MISKSVEFFNDFIALVFPQLCVTCENSLLSNEKIICTNCRTTLPKTYGWLDVENPLFLRLKGRLNVKYAFSFLKYGKGGEVQKLLKELKYKDNIEIGRMLGQWLGSTLADAGFINQFDVIIPVPLHKTKLAKRGYNQSEELANGFCEQISIKIDITSVLRNKYTQPQVNFSGDGRWMNVKNAFCVQDPGKIEGKHIALIDDVITTGATIETLALEIEKFNPASISIIVLADANN